MYEHIIYRYYILICTFYCIQTYVYILYTHVHIHPHTFIPQVSHCIASNFRFILLLLTYTSETQSLILQTYLHSSHTYKNVCIY